MLANAPQRTWADNVESLFAWRCCPVDDASDENDSGKAGGTPCGNDDYTV